MTSFLGRQARRGFRRLPQPVQNGVRALIGKPVAAPPPPALTEAMRLAQTFHEVFGQEPGPAERERLAWLAGATAQATPHQRQRRVIAAFDQQEHATGMSVRWDGSDVDRVEIEGLRLLLDAADISVSEPLRQGRYESHVLAYFRRTLRPGMHVVDAGANLGLYSLLAARLVAPTGRVTSFEPNSENCRFLLASALENGLDNIQLHPVALAAARGHTCFTSALGSNGGIVSRDRQDLLHRSCRIVPTARLDDFALPRLDLMKMDVEGAEGLLLDGAIETLRRCRPLIVCEFSDEMLRRISGRLGHQFLAQVRELGWRIDLLDKSSHALVPVQDIAGFAETFVGNGRIEDLVLTPAERG